MQETEIKKIIELVKSSPAFDENERQEWLQLVELMNDKQLLELQKILASFTVGEKEQVMPGISLSHIVNPPQEKKPEAQPKPPVVPVKPQQERQQAFGQKLHAIVEEKELTGNSHPPLKLPEHGTPDQKAPEKIILNPVSVSKPVVKPAVPARPPVPSQPQTHIQNGPIRISPKKVLLNEPAVIRDRAPESFVEQLEKFNQKQKAAPILTKTSIQSTEDRVFRAGLENTEVLLNAKIQKEKQAQEKEAALEEKIKAVRPELPALQKQAPVSTKLETLQDVSALSLRVFKQSPPDALKKKLTEIIKSSGYHQVIFNLEHSPLYSAYISTGLKVLKESLSFEALGEQSSSIEENYMTRQEFEQFTDLLRQIQAN